MKKLQNEIWEIILSCLPHRTLNELPFFMMIESIFEIKNRGSVICGRILSGTIKSHNKIFIEDSYYEIAGIEMFRKILDQAEAGDNVGILIDIDYDSFKHEPGSIAWNGNDYIQKFLNIYSLTSKINKKYGCNISQKDIRDKCPSLPKLIQLIMNEIDGQSDSFQNTDTLKSQNEKPSVKDIRKTEIQSTDKNSRKDIERMYRAFRDGLLNFQNNIKSIKGKNPEIAALQNDLVSALNTVIEKIQKEAEIAINIIPWDRLVIAFFGETNAGKSTIIETFRTLYESNRPKDSDGLIVGDGRQDFTKEYNKYDLNINGRPFTLIDVPGIEGKESDYIESIKDAVRRSHIVFYVHGKNQKPDEGTAAKIKQYLADWIKVYTIQNVKGGASNYDEPEERESLLTKQMMKVSDGLSSEFVKLIGDNFCGNITVQALLALCVNANFSPQRKDLLKTRDKLLNYFESKERLWEFSNFEALTDLVYLKSGNFTNEILKSNYQKMVALSKVTISVLDQVINQNESKLNTLKNLLIKFKRDVKSITNSHKRILKTNMQSVTEESFAKLKERLFDLIDDAPKDLKKRAEFAVNSTSYNLTQRLNKAIKDTIKSMDSDIDKKRKSLQGIKDSNIYSQTSVGFDMSLDSALYELDFNLDDFGSYAFSVSSWASAGIAIGAFGGAPGMAIGGTIGAICGGVYQYFTGDDKKAKAKKEISDSIDNAYSELLVEIIQERLMIENTIDSYEKFLNKSIQEELNKIDKLKESLESIRQELELKIKLYNN